MALDLLERGDERAGLAAVVVGMAASRAGQLGQRVAAIGVLTQRVLRWRTSLSLSSTFRWRGRCASSPDGG